MWARAPPPPPRLWPFALVLWLANRALDGLDGPVARASGASDLGGFFDIVADFTIYGGFVVGIAIAVPAARLACVVLLLAYYVSGTALLALSSLLERAGRSGDETALLALCRRAGRGSRDDRRLHAVLSPAGLGKPIAWAFAAAVGITAVQRIVFGARLLRPDARHAGRQEARSRARLTMSSGQEQPLTHSHPRTPLRRGRRGARRSADAGKAGPHARHEGQPQRRSPSPGRPASTTQSNGAGGNGSKVS